MKRRSGFTLIEVLVALAIFGIMSTLAYMSLAQTLDKFETAVDRTLAKLSRERVKGMA